MNNEPKHVGKVELTTDIELIKLPHLYHDMASGQYGKEDYRVGIAVNGSAFYVFLREKVFAIPLFQDNGPMWQLVKHIFNLDFEAITKLESKPEDKS
jgi:hypothetical protein